MLIAAFPSKSLGSEGIFPDLSESEPIVRIMPLGDSITQADGEHGSYRRPLWNLLRQAGYEVEFVGSTQNHFGGPPPFTDFDPDHEGHWGWRTDEILVHINNWVSSARPNIVLIHLGTNDVRAGQSLESTMDELWELIQALRLNNPFVKVLLAQVIPTVENEAQVAQLNQRIALIAEYMSMETSPVLLVDQFSGFNPAVGQDTYDGVHPNELGERKLAEQWFNALQQILAPPQE
ncbi:MAG: SGNH/GDSL hydrolase family protein [Leptolyngbyaceae cyanobacterium MO_188.B28]|nr:SGNH/GDSL hydrolase family protein [Leptolyngbyaceae cyanobacterium MO_188.B28]